jgi:hypothetical protein
MPTRRPPPHTPPSRQARLSHTQRRRNVLSLWSSTALVAACCLACYLIYHVS